MTDHELNDAYNPYTDPDKMRAPVAGDLWNEMMAVWLWVQEVNDTTVTIRTGPGGVRVDELERLETIPAAAFKGRLRHMRFSCNTYVPSKYKR